MSSAASTVISLTFRGSIIAIIYTDARDPFLVFLLAKLKRRVIPETELDFAVTVLIAAYNEEREIERKIKNSLALDFPKDNLQILIITDGSSYRTPQLVQSYAQAGVECMHMDERRGKMAAINRAMPYVRGEIVVFSDAY